MAGRRPTRQVVLVMGGLTSLAMPGLAFGLFLSPLHLQQFPEGGHHVAEVCHDDHRAKDG
jgi:hypothetical protein